MAVELPDELIVQILLMLPAKSLLRCRLVCKSWLNLISSTKFKLMHLHSFNQLNPRYFVRFLDYSMGKEWFCVHFDDEAFTFDTDVEFPFNVYRIVGCCNGLVCLCDDDDDANEDGFSLDTIILWNPSIRRKLTLTLPTFDPEGSSDVLGLGYDKISDDYKLVRLVYAGDLFTRPHVEVYAVKTGIWREVVFPDNLRYLYVDDNRKHVFSNGYVHWIAFYPTPGRLRLHNSIMTFDTSTELFGEILLPDDLLKVVTTASTIMVSVVGESLAVTYYNNRTRMASSTYKIWVMKEYKNPTSWTLIHNMRYPDIDMGRPLKLGNKGIMILGSWDKKMIVYNYSGYACRICPRYESTMRCGTYVDKYQESLALLDVGHSVSNENGE